MNSILKHLHLIIFFAISTPVFFCSGEDLIKPADGMVRYKLSNFRVNTGITGDGISFDYRRTSEGKGQAKLRIRTNQGSTSVMGLPIQIKESGTINLRDMFGRARSIINRNQDDGIAFYFVVDLGRETKQLVSNVLRNGSPKVNVSPRELTQEERDEIERRRIASLPPKTLPSGYIRGTATTQLVPGAPIMLGRGGEWKSGVVVSLPTSSTVKVKADDAMRLLTLTRSDWIAVSQQTQRDIATNPGQFSNKVRALPKGDLVLEDDMTAFSVDMNIAKGTPLKWERYGSWIDVFFLSTDNVSVRLLSRQYGKSKVEFVPLNELAILNRSLTDQSNEQAKAGFAANVANLGTETSSLSGTPGSMKMVGGLASATSSPKLGSTLSPKMPEKEPQLGPVRKWSDQTGNFGIEAQFVKREGDNILLKRADQRTISIPLEKLSDADQEHLKQEEQKQAMEADNPFGDVVDGVAISSDVDYSRSMQPKLTVDDLGWGAKSVAICPRNRFMLIGRAGSSATLVDLNSGQKLIDSERMDHMGDIFVCEFSKSSEYVVLGGYKGVFEVYLTDSKGRLELKGQHKLHSSEITALALSADSKFAFSGERDKVARYWELETGQPIATIDGFEGKIKTTHISPSGDQLMATDGKTLKVYSVSQKKVIATFEVARSHVSGQAAAFSPDGSKLATGDSYDIVIWDLVNSRKLGVLEGDAINWSMSFAPDNRHLLSGANGVIHVWDCDQMAKVQTNHIGKSFYVQAIAVSNDGTLVAAPSAFKTVAVLGAAQ